MPHRAKLISQQRIAADLGFSQSLVSKVLNGSHAGIPDATVRAVWRHAREQGYRPRGIDLDLFVADAVATRMVGYILRSPLRLTSESHIFQHAHEGLHRHLARNNVRTVFIGTESDIDPMELAAVMRRQKLMLGLVLMGEVQREFMQSVAGCGKPMVVISGRHPGLAHSMLSDFAQSGELLVEHLHRLGHRRFAWIGSGHSAGSLARHRDALVQALDRRGLVLEPRYEAVGPEADRHHGHEAAADLLDRNRRRPPTALICFNAMMARAAMNLIFQRGLHVPRDLSVAAFDMTGVCTEERPHITSAAAAPEMFGLRAAELILAQGHPPEGGGLREIVLPSELVRRDTSGPAPHPTPRRRS
ncbi:MAG: LacI family DNA-binding transcriptional regulator [Opitutaceae bacterium]|nr:LacI family DNA-binding transcriptional regulator [Opitutaceae bacterium]